MEIDEDSCWQHLPPVILIEIFSCLSPAERFPASLVCRSWSQTFTAPCLWRNFSYEFEGSAFMPCYDRRALQFARQLGRHVRKLTISCHRPSYSGCSRAQKNMTTFSPRELFGLRNRAQVTHLVMQNLKFKRHWHHDFACDRIVSSLEKFLMTQRRLQIVDLSDMDVGVKNGILILQAIVVNCSGTLKELFLEDFLTVQEDVIRNSQYKTIMSNWRNLHTVALNYSALDSEILLQLIRNNFRTLDTVKIKCRKKDICNHVISEEVWRKVTKLCPSIKISMFIERIPNFTAFKHTLPGEIPLKSFHFWTGYDLQDDNIWGLNEFLIYIKNKFAKRVEILNLEFEDNLEFIDNCLVDFLASCDSLKCLELTASVNISTVDVICALLITKNTGLTKFHVTLNGINIEDNEILRAIEIKYLSAFLEKGVDFYCSADWI